MTEEEKLLSFADLYRILGTGQKPGSFANWITRAKQKHGFPAQIVSADRSTRWLWTEVKAWLDSRPRSDASRSPRKKAAKSIRPKRMTMDERVAKGIWVCEHEFLRVRGSSGRK